MTFLITFNFKVKAMRGSLLLILTVIFFQGIQAQNIYFPPNTGSVWETIPPSDLGWCTDRIDSLYGFLGQTNTKGFLVLKDGKIVLEKYFGTFTKDSLWYWASAGKTITSLLTGIAQEEGALDIQHPSSDYLGAGWSSLSPAQESNVKVWNHLTMTTGLNDDVPDLDCTLPSCLTYLAAPGTRWAYHNAPYTLLDSIIRSATGQTLNGFTNTRLKNKTGMTGTWIKVGYNNVFFSTARSMARFGILIHNDAVWNAQVVLGDAAYFNQMISTSQNLNQAYGYLWWLNGTDSYMLPGIQNVFNGSAMPDAPDDMVAALGKNGQILNVSPSTGFTVVRMGNLPTQNIFVPNVYNNQIWEYINQLACGNTGVETTSPNSDLLLFPNPVYDKLYLHQMLEGAAEIKIYDATGRMVLKPDYSEKAIHVGGLPGGIYTLTVSDGGQNLSARFIKK
jgi:CubicO group peptidase (beta-lactamase class C family)